MYNFGYTEQVEQLCKQPATLTVLNQVNITVWNDFGNIINSRFKRVGLQIFCQNNSRLFKDLFTCDDLFIIVAAMKVSNGMVGQHVIAIFNAGIYDANCQFVMKKTQELLDWCCGDGDETCAGTEWLYQLLSKHHK